ncbi:MAG: serine/threonine protein kinase [Kofleriaceae bacterium]
MDGVPSRLGRYELLARLATGGMGEVFLARLEGAAGFEKLYAIKRILPHLATDERFRKMLVTEAQIASKMAHPNICQVYELGETNGQLYIVMEYLEGVTLLQLLRRASRDRSALHVGFVASVIGQVCDALQYAHELRDRNKHDLGIIHRDVSPANVFVCESGMVKVLDFGIAKVKDSANTQTDSVKGKFAYMAPEQLKGTQLTRRVDVFALGVVTFEALALRRLFQRKTDYLTFQAVMELPIADVRRYRSDVPESLAAAIERALERSAADRWDTVREFRLSAFADAKPWSQEKVGELVRARFAGEIERTQIGIEAAVTRTGLHPDALSTPLVPHEEIDAEDDVDFPAVETDARARSPALRAVSEVSSRPASTRSASRTPVLVGAVLALAVVAAGAVAMVMLWRQNEQVAPPAKVEITQANADTSRPELDETANKHKTAFSECVLRHGSTWDAIFASMTVSPDGKAAGITIDPADAMASPLGQCFIGVYTAIAFPPAAAERSFTQTISLPKGPAKKPKGNR